MEVFFCDVCGKRICEADFTRGDALQQENESYCRDCLKTSPKVPDSVRSAFQEQPGTTRPATSGRMRAAQTEIFFCEVCGKRIDGADFTRGKALHQENKSYCRNCLKVSPRVPESVRAAFRELLDTPRPATSGRMRAVRAARRPARQRSSGSIPARSRRSRAPSGATTRVVVIVGIGLTAVLLLLIMASRQPTRPSYPRASAQEQIARFHKRKGNGGGAPRPTERVRRPKLRVTLDAPPSMPAVPPAPAPAAPSSQPDVPPAPRLDPWTSSVPSVRSVPPAAPDPGPIEGPKGPAAPAEKSEDPVARAEALINAFQFPAARDLIDVYLRDNPDDGKALTLRGELSLMDRDFEAALRDFNRAIEQDGSLAAAYYGRGIVRARQGKPDESAQDLRTALRHDADSIDIRIDLALVLFLNWQDRDAIAVLLEILELAPGLSNELLDQIEWAEEQRVAQMRVSEPDTAVKFVYRARARLLDASTPTPGADAARTLVEQAVQDLKRALKLDRRVPDALYHLAGAYEHPALKDEYAAISYYDQALRQTPEDYRVLNNLAWLLLTCESPRLRRPSRALRLARKAAKITKGNPRPAVTATCLDTLAQAYAKTGRLADAIATQRKVLEMFPDNADFSAHLREFEARQTQPRRRQ